MKIRLWPWTLQPTEPWRTNFFYLSISQCLVFCYNNINELGPWPNLNSWKHSTPACLGKNIEFLFLSVSFHFLAEKLPVCIKEKAAQSHPLCNGSLWRHRGNYSLLYYIPWPIRNKEKVFNVLKVMCRNKKILRVLTSKHFGNHSFILSPDVTAQENSGGKGNRVSFQNCIWLFLHRKEEFSP